jgi:hypothetical protein
MAGGVVAGKVRKEVADKLGATRGVFHARTLGMLYPHGSVADTVVSPVATHDLREVLPGVGDASADHQPQSLAKVNATQKRLICRRY